MRRYGQYPLGWQQFGHLGLTSTFGAFTPGEGVGAIDRLILVGDDGYAVDFVSGQMRVNYAATPAKNFLGSFASKLYVNGVLTPGTDGCRFDLTNFARMLNTDWPYNNTAITIDGLFKFDTATDAALRWMMTFDAGGNDSLATFLGAGSDKPTMVTGFGASSGNTAATTGVGADTWKQITFSAGPSGEFAAVNDVVEASRTEPLAAAASLLNYHGIGATPASAGNSVNTNPMLGRVRSLTVLARAIEPAALIAGRPFPITTKALVGIGDSHTYNNSYGVTKAEFWPQVVTSRLGSRLWLPRNFGVSGNSTAQMLNRIATTVAYGNPEIAIVEGGTNDVMANTTVSASPSPTDTVFTVAAITYYAVNGWITVAGEQAQIQSIAGNQITLTAALAGGAPATGAAVTIDTQKNLQEIIAYWQGLGITKVAVVGVHYLNYASGGDTTSVQQTLAGACRVLQAAAAAAKSVPYIDCYEQGRQLILAGTYTQGDDLAWHVATSNPHLTAVGERVLIADAVSAEIATQGWA